VRSAERSAWCCPSWSPDNAGLVGGEGRHHRRLRRAQAAAVSSPTAVPPRRGRPCTPPQNSVVNPTQHHHKRWGRREHRNTREASIGGRAPGGPSRGRLAHRRRVDQADRREPIDRRGSDRPAGTAVIRTGGCPWLRPRRWMPGAADHERQDHVWRLSVAAGTAMANRYMSTAGPPSGLLL
jgi:hypothetical protein